MKIAIIRGADLGEYEMQNYAPLVRKGLDLVGFTSKKPKGRTSKLKFPVKQLYMLGDFSNISKYRAALCRLFGDVQVMIGLEKSLKGFDVAHGAETFNYYTYQAIKAKLSGKVKRVVVTVWQNIPLSGEINPVQRAFKKIVLENTDLFHAVTEQAKEALLIDGVEEKKIKVLPYGIDLDVFKPDSKKKMEILKKLGLSPSDFVILSIGRLVWEKGFDYLLMAFKKLLLQKRITNKSLKLLIVGEGPRRQILEQMVNRLDLDGRIIFTGKIPYDEVPMLHSIADIFVLLSLPVETWQEQFGMVFLESMACGKPVIAGKSGAILEVVGDAGILVPPGDVGSVARAMENLIMDENLRSELGKKALLRAKNKFDAEKVAEKLFDLYMSLFQDKREPRLLSRG